MSPTIAVAPGVELVVGAAVEVEGDDGATPVVVGTLADDEASVDGGTMVEGTEASDALGALAPGAEARSDSGTVVVVGLPVKGSGRGTTVGPTGTFVDEVVATTGSDNSWTEVDGDVPMSTSTVVVLLKRSPTAPIIMATSTQAATAIPPATPTRTGARGASWRDQRRNGPIGE